MWPLLFPFPICTEFIVFYFVLLSILNFLDFLLQGKALSPSWHSSPLSMSFQFLIVSSHLCTFYSELLVTRRQLCLACWTSSTLHPLPSHTDAWEMLRWPPLQARCDSSKLIPFELKFSPRKAACRRTQTFSNLLFITYPLLAEHLSQQLALCWVCSEMCCPSLLGISD